ncbi:amidohydrolase family protein [Kitasatospora sp. NBC_00240]|uniref:amidohydrolase family protein n=1 Tax=Kitasatospora sp. NBC_00240 TaxID=2903567 RepID=UPI00224E91D2|nr:amidohydrolase family protein [Kitasatospora sp. NBC_00240]MCX5208910.1 amidohydrolase family protein [Kitasatospora sp. NBC_00240]
MTDRLIIDSHHHLWDLAVRPQPWITGEALAPLARSFSAADLAPEAGAAGVVGTVAVQTVCLPEETPELLALAAGSDLVAGVVGWTDLTAPDVRDAIAALRGQPGGNRLVGIRHQVQEEPDPEWLLRADVRRGLLAVAEAGLAYDLVVQPHQLPAATLAAAGLTGLTFVLDHLGKPPIATGALEPWAADLRRLAALPNTVCKLSGLVTEAAPGTWRTQDLKPYADTVLDAFGPRRLLFGSDWPVCTLEAGYGEVVRIADHLTEGLSPAEKRALFHRNAIRVYGLEETEQAAGTALMPAAGAREAAPAGGGG